MGAVIIWGRLDDITILGPNLAVALLTFLYGLVATLLLIPIYTRLKVKLIEEKKDTDLYVNSEINV